LILNWRPKPEGERRLRKKKVVGESISAPPRSKKGKQKAAMEDDPIDFFDDMYDNDDGVNPTGSTSLSTVNDATSYSSTNNTTRSFLLPPSSISSSATPEMDPAVLYKKMLALRAEVRSFYPHAHKF
jgi:hypothetical protein